MKRSPLIKLFVILPSLAVCSFLHGDALRLKTGETIEGELLRMEADFVLLRIAGDESEVIRRFSPEQVQLLQFTDEAQALEARARRRALFPGLLSEADERMLPDAIDLYLGEERALEALAYAKLWHPKLEHAVNRKRVSLQMIQAAYDAGFKDEAAFHAQTWIRERQTPVEEAFPWQVVSEFHLDAGRYENALSIALQPIAFLQNKSPGDLKSCYQIAIDAYEKLGFREHAMALLAELEGHSPVATEIIPPLTLPSLQQKPLSFQDILKTKAPQ